MSQDSRIFSRVAAHLAVSVTCAGVTRTGTCQDVSLTGLFALVEAPFPAHSIVEVRIPVGDTHITAAGRVVRSTATGMAIIFEELADPDSYGHLQRLVLLNCPTEAAAEQADHEIVTHFGIRRTPPEGSPGDSALADPRNPQ